ncbi:DUF1847 domain-containing protein [Methanobacterium alcaliphilum]|uniref:DUF1847 domain-containing protein n=1 Tax=Methanobacterium alcaliphilum TaxID=392018 RepID=UPI00200B946D|nr:DUF1847 domain-containing protein [Methanobacterium alcaliphilum]MCK9151111.1 DUF1847 domain-containing protein [Methanobacterium alcaliphilum]
MKCASCTEKSCRFDKDCTNIKEKVRNSYTNDEIGLMKAAGEVEARYYMQKTRIEEIIIFSKKMNYKKLGLAFCVGLERETYKINKILEKHFKVYSVCCKVCGIDKDEYDIDKIQRGSWESLCNPLAQAEILNKKDTDINIAIGICLGHDMLFSKHSRAPVTTLIVKDRVLAHNPAGAIYSKYYMNKILNSDL